eukprot:2643267-Pleurochrysis_carterae.AAC.1
MPCCLAASSSRRDAATSRSRADASRCSATISHSSCRTAPLPCFLAQQQASPTLPSRLPLFETATPAAVFAVSPPPRARLERPSHSSATFSTCRCACADTLTRALLNKSVQFPPSLSRSLPTQPPPSPLRCRSCPAAATLSSASLSTRAGFAAPAPRCAATTLARAQPPQSHLVCGEQPLPAPTSAS